MTSRDVARLAEVSQATVSRVLNGDKRMSSATTDRVIEAARQLGYIPSELGRSLSTRTTRQVAIVADLDNELYPRLVGPIHDELEVHGFRTLLLAERGDDSRKYQRLLDGSIDGAILTTTHLHGSLPRDLSLRRLPFVLLNRVSEVIEADSVTASNSEGAASVGELFLELGHRHVGAILGPEETSTSRDRERGLLGVLNERHVALPPRWVRRGPFSYESGRQSFVSIMSERDRPTVVFCANDMLAVGALSGAADLGMAVPETVSVVGFDDLEFASWPPIQLTTVHTQFSLMAKTAATMLVELLQGDPASVTPRRTVFQTTLVKRRTHAPPGS